MAWRDTLMELRQQLAATREQRLVKAGEDNAEREVVRKQLSDLVASLEVTALLEEMNTVMLEGKGKIETFLSWEDSDEDEPPASDTEFLNSLELEEDVDVISLVLTWEEDGERELDVDVGDSDDGLYVQIAGVEIRQERPALEAALAQAFREELEL